MPTNAKVMLLVVVLVAAGLFYAGCATERGRWERALTASEKLVKQRDSIIAVLRADSAKLDERYRIDTLTLTQWKTKWKTLTDTLRISDTDTITIEKVVAVADNTIRACAASLTTCENRIGNAESRAAKADSNVADLKRLLAKPKPLITFERGTLGIALIVGGVCALTTVC